MTQIWNWLIAHWLELTTLTAVMIAVDAIAALSQKVENLQDQVGTLHRHMGRLLYPDERD